LQKIKYFCKIKYVCKKSYIFAKVNWHELHDTH
jgi:hypothetical protein